MSNFDNESEWRALSDEQLDQNIIDTERLLELFASADETSQVALLKTVYRHQLGEFMDERERRRLHNNGHNPGLIDK